MIHYTFLVFFTLSLMIIHGACESETSLHHTTQHHQSHTHKYHFNEHDTFDHTHTHELHHLFNLQQCPTNQCIGVPIPIPLGTQTLAVRATYASTQRNPSNYDNPSSYENPSNHDSPPNHGTIHTSIYQGEELIYQGPLQSIWQEKSLMVGRLDLHADMVYTLIIHQSVYRDFAQLNLFTLPTLHPKSNLHIHDKMIWGQAKSSTSNPNGTHTPPTSSSIHNHQVNHESSDKMVPYLEQKHFYLRPDFVRSREMWGARSADQICNSVVAPYRMSIHHTASPDSDGGDPAMRMREMQAFHMDVRGWCDLGYHFVVAQNGSIFEGRRGENRPAAHVGGENAGNIGISLIGNFEEQVLAKTQFDALVHIMAWNIQTYDLTIDRTSIRGHREWPEQTTRCPGRDVLQRFDAILYAVADWIEYGPSEEREQFIPRDPVDMSVDGYEMGLDLWMQDPWIDMNVSLDFTRGMDMNVVDIGGVTNRADFSSPISRSMVDQSMYTEIGEVMPSTISTPHAANRSNDQGCQHSDRFHTLTVNPWSLLLALIVFLIHSIFRTTDRISD